MIRAKILIIISFFLVIGGIVSEFSPVAIKANNDKILQEISTYQSWSQIHKPDENSKTGFFMLRSSLFGGWTVGLIFFGSENILLNSDIIFQEENKSNESEDIKKAITESRQRLIMPDEEGAFERGEKIETKEFYPLKTKKTKVSPHEIGWDTFGRVYGNEKAASQMGNSVFSFPVGSIIVREKYKEETQPAPEILTAMVKREKGFSKKTGDWEYFTFNGSDLRLIKRETKSDCSKCHAQAKENDYVFRNFLK